MTCRIDSQDRRLGPATCTFCLISGSSPDCAAWSPPRPANQYRRVHGRPRGHADHGEAEGHLRREAKRPSRHRGIEEAEGRGRPARRRWQRGRSQACPDAILSGHGFARLLGWNHRASSRAVRWGLFVRAPDQGAARRSCAPPSRSHPASSIATSAAQSQAKPRALSSRAAGWSTAAPLAGHWPRGPEVQCSRVCKAAAFQKTLIDHCVFEGFA